MTNSVDAITKKCLDFQKEPKQFVVWCDGNEIRCDNVTSKLEFY